jgi:hypothetical protein
VLVSTRERKARKKAGRLVTRLADEIFDLANSAKIKEKIKFVRGNGVTFPWP